MFRYQQDDQPDATPGSVLEFSYLEPLAYQALLDARPNQPVACEFVAHPNAVQTVEGGIHQGSSYDTVRGRLESPFTSRAIALVEGGWLPSRLAVRSSDTPILLDRNIVSEIVGRHPLTQQPSDFLDLLDGEQVAFNHLLYALEGNSRSIPSEAEARQQHQESLAKLQVALPNASFAAEEHRLRAAIALLNELRPTAKKSIDFLCKIAPLIHAPVSGKNMRARWSEVQRIALESQLRRDSLVVFAAMSSVAAPHGKSPAKRVLKLESGYTEGDAYNAIVDLNALQFLLHGIALAPDRRPQLWTADRDLALLWVGLRVHNIQREGNRVSCSFSPVQQLLPNGWAREWADWVRA